MNPTTNLLICGPSGSFYIYCFLFHFRFFQSLIILHRLCGYPPFYADNAPALFKRIMEVQYDFDDPSWDVISNDAKNLVKALLLKEPQPAFDSSTSSQTSLGYCMKFFLVFTFCFNFSFSGGGCLQKFDLFPKAERISK